jgi:ABC-type Fe3+/spermidine/putrescine transport system ATPase subunit
MHETERGLRIEQASISIADFTLTADFAVEPGERAAIQGASGSGKTTLLRAIAGLEPMRGGLRLDGRDLSKVEPQKREIGYVAQDPALFDTMDVAENAAFGLRMRGMGRDRRRAEAESWLGRVGLDHRADAGVGRLSGGEKQRLAFVRALIWRPRLILLDEPFSALDPALRVELRGILLALLSAVPAPMLMVTHDVEDVSALSTCSLTLREESPGVRRIVR